MVQWCKKKKQNLCGTQFTISKQWEQIYDHSGQQRSDTIFFFKTHSNDTSRQRALTASNKA